jgi:squalene synthase HpnC
MPRMDRRFLTELTKYGPDQSWPPIDHARAQAYCAKLARSHYENFSVTSLLLPRRLLRHFHAVYAYSRWADDLADEAGGGAGALRLLGWWREELLRCYDGKPRHPVMVALHGTIRQFHIPPKPFLDLLVAFEQDQVVKRYATYDQLCGYCRNSANPVGHLVLYLAEAYDEKRAALADRICTALQQTNFWQDVARDLELGRVYLPEEDRQRFGYTEDDLAARRFTPAFAELMRFELERTRDLFYRGFQLVEEMPDAVQADVELFIQGGLAVLRKIEQIGYNVWDRRPALAKWEKGVLVASTLWRRLRTRLAGS